MIFKADDFVFQPNFGDGPDDRIAGEQGSGVVDMLMFASPAAPNAVPQSDGGASHVDSWRDVAKATDGSDLQIVQDLSPSIPEDVGIDLGLLIF
ncbi:MAG: hypothetical protein AAF914_09640 [Pseudomonadota bacterium]